MKTALQLKNTFTNPIRLHIPLTARYEPFTTRYEGKWKVIKRTKRNSVSYHLLYNDKVVHFVTPYHYGRLFRSKGNKLETFLRFICSEYTFPYIQTSDNPYSNYDILVESEDLVYSIYYTYPELFL